MGDQDTERSNVKESIRNEEVDTSTKFHELKTPKESRRTHLTNPNEHENLNKSPLDNATWISCLTLWWLNSLLRQGYQSTLQEETVPELPLLDQSTSLQEMLDQHWEEQKKSRSDPKFHVALWKSTKDRMTLAIFLHILSASLTLIQPLLIKAILQHLQNEDNIFGIKSGYGLAGALTATSFCSVTFLSYGMFLTGRAGSNARMIVVNSVYQKILKLSSTARRTLNSGEIVTLASVDSERIYEAYAIGLWSSISPLMLVAVCILIGIQMGVFVALAAAVTIFTCLALGFSTSRRVGLFRREIAKASAERVKFTNEVLQGIRLIKFYAWENSIGEKIRNLRDREIFLLRKYNYLRFYNAVLMYLAPLFVNVVSFVVYVLLDNRLTVATAFAVLALTNITKMPFGIFANASVYVSEAWASTGRISKFLLADEIDHYSANQTYDEDHAYVIQICSGEFRWIQTSPEPVLKDINICISPGSLTIIVGVVGSGKTSLINAILGEMHQSGGEMRADGSVALASQQPWIQNNTVRENILFGQDMDKAHYNKVVDACQLLPDLKMLEHGDETEIGERGINLSGGQKARVSIARAMYRKNAKVLILDDPLSALDVHVANAVFYHGLNDLAKEKTRILVLNAHYHLLRHADQVIVMSEGSIVGRGTLEELRNRFGFLCSSEIGRNLKNSPSAKKKEKNSKENIEVMASIEKGEVKKKLTIAEDRATGSVNIKTYIKYLSCCGWNGWAVGISTFAAFALAQLAVFACDFFISLWSNGSINLQQNTLLGIYVSLIALCSLLVFLRCLYYTEICVRCSGNLHYEYMKKVLAAPVTTFFDVTPIGRILNRFSRDLDQIDNPFPYFSMWMLQYFFVVVTAFLVCAVTNPYTLILYLPLFVMFYYVQQYFQATARELKRLDGITRSPFLNIVAETINGIETIRAFKMDTRFARRCENLLDHNAKFFFAFQASSRWFSMRMDWLVVSVISVVAFLSVDMKTVNAAVAGIALTYAAQLSSSFQRMMTLISMTENIMTSFERISYYGTLEEEGSKRLGLYQTTPELWPSSGDIVFENVCMRYRDNLDLVLKDVSFHINCGEKIGICGRTGSGKSSMMNLLFRMVECSDGRILIDHVDISTIPINQLRSKLTIIPQDPVLFSGSLRLNLDPFDKNTDEELWNVLKKVHLIDDVVKWGEGLEYEVAEKGENISVGQRQLLCIARALIRDSKVVVLDEATANVDQESDKLIQQTVRDSFHGKTMLCIAHRLETIMESDRILLLDAGQVKEFDSPVALLQNPESVFHALVNEVNSSLTAV